MDWILPDYFNPVIAVSPSERMAATLHESAKPNMSQSEGDDPPQPAAAPSNSTQSPHNMKKTNGKSSKKGKKSKSCKSPQRSSKQDSNVDLHSDSADVPAKSSHGPVRIKGVKSKKAKTSKSKKSPQRSSRQDLSAGDSQSEPADVQSNSPHCPHKMKETKCKPAKKEKSGNSPKKTTKQPQHTEDATTCENDIQGAHTPKRKCSSKSRPAPGKKKGQNGKMPKPCCSRKQVSFTTPACDATDPEEEDIADSTTLFGSPESESGTSSAGWSRSKVTYAVGKKGRMSTPKALRRRAAPGCKRHLKAGAAPRPASERSAAPVSHPKRTRRNALVVAKPAVLFRDPNDPLGMLSAAFSPGLPVAGPSGSTAPPATVSAGPETARAGPSTSAETDEEEDMEPLDDQQFDQEIQRKATKAKISVRNVKHIIKSIISNEQVLAMMRYAESREANPDGATLPPSMEPKMTRARARQLADTHLTQLPLTPVKRGSTADQLIAQEFPEDDDDDEYTPEKEVDESVATASPCSSPAPSSPRSPSVCSSQPQTPRTPGSVASEADEPLSRRTRSRLPLNDMALEELERLLVAPDVEPDTYFPVDDEDEDWVGFLRGFSAPPTSTDAPEEEEEDEEYVFQVQEEEEVEREEMRRDPAVRIPQKEVNKLMLELMKDVDELQWTDLPDPNQLPTQPIRIPKTPLTMMTDSQAKQLDHQMIAHVQLLAQTHMLCSEHDWLRAEQAGCAALLVELNSLSSTLHPEDPTRSFFHPPNLAPALQLVADVERMTPEQLADDPSKFFT
ncbi:GON-4-like protein [Amphibalanus amphitrite]|uniref:GON-4-like protein n=1 Tax=Amphibalanus amphitrite TaxID=1232801 RepID=A0A6A4VLE0_AMPAM|nr:GON-4-like protein [Amphibalanus amphitrite]